MRVRAVETVHEEQTLFVVLVPSLCNALPLWGEGVEVAEREDALLVRAQVETHDPRSRNGTRIGRNPARA